MTEKIITARQDDVVRAEMLTAISTLTATAAKQMPRDGAAALRDLAEAYSMLTAMPLPPAELRMG